jgi:flagellar basal-body rod protein FlgB
VNAITDNAIVAALGRQMTRAVARETVAASNLANLDTPNYKTREATFADALDTQIGTVPLPMASPSSGASLGAVAGSPDSTREVQGLAERRDGNTVQLDRELVELTKASADFSAAQTALAAKFRLVRYAINEGR